jgi:tetratricopeptide (TPR) repeat protein
MPIRRLIAVILLAPLVLAGCQTLRSAPQGFDEKAVMFGKPTAAELAHVRATLVENATERGMTPAQAANGFSRLGWERLVARKYDDAMPYLNRAWALDPQNATAIAGLAMVRKYRDGDVKNALADLRKAIQIRPDDPALRIHYGRLLADERRDDDAIAAFLQALTLDPRTPNAHLALAILYQRKGDYRKALDHARIGHRLGEIPDPLWVRALEEKVAEDS